MDPDLEAGSTPSRTPAAAAPLLRLENVFTCIAALLAALCFMSAVLGFDPLGSYRPTFSVEVAGFAGLDGPRPAPVVSPAFNLTLHGVSDRPLRVGSLGLCQELGTVAVSYAGAVLAWGRVPAFCVPAHGSRHVGMVALGADVGLSDELRGRMASERLQRAANLDVDIMLDRERLLSCRVKIDQSSPQKPSPCTVFAGSW